MEWIKVLQMAIDYMEQHLLETINYEDVSHYVNMSQYNFHRTFSLIVGITANEYIRNRRLSLAGQELQMEGGKIIDIAYKYGYETPESFSKAFTRFHGITPTESKMTGKTLSLFPPLVIKITLEGGKSMDYRIVEAEAMRFIVKVGTFKNEIMNEVDNHEIPDFWSECHEKHLVERIRELHPEGKRDLYGLCCPTKADETTFDYGIGVLYDMNLTQSAEEALLDEGYSIWNLKPSKYAVFKCYGHNGDCISEMWSRFFKEFLPQTGYTHSDQVDFEIYFEKGEPGLFCELWIPIE